MMVKAKDFGTAKDSNNLSVYFYSVNSFRVCGILRCVSVEYRVLR